MYAWQWEPSVLIGLALLAGGYLAGVGPLRGRFAESAPVPRWRSRLFLVGVLILFIALVSPLDTLADSYLLSMHMVQHLLITLIVPPLLLAGTPGWLLRPLLRPRYALSIGRAITNPVFAFLVFNMTFAAWHVPALYELTLVGSGGDSVDPLRYGAKATAAGGKADEIGLLRLRYKQPGGEHSRLLEKALSRTQIHPSASPRLRWSAAVAAYADLLRGGSHTGSWSWNEVRTLAAGAKGEDRWGYRAEFLDLVDKASAVTGGKPPVAINE